MPDEWPCARGAVEAKAAWLRTEGVEETKAARVRAMGAHPAPLPDACEPCLPLYWRTMQQPVMTSIEFLRRPSIPADPTDPADLAVADDLKDTLEANRARCVGMAANMIGVSKRVIAFVDEDMGGRIVVMFNPVIEEADGAYDTAEGCLSLEGERRAVRHSRIEVGYQDRRGRARRAAFTGWTA